MWGNLTVETLWWKIFIFFTHPKAWCGQERTPNPPTATFLNLQVYVDFTYDSDLVTQYEYPSKEHLYVIIFLMILASIEDLDPPLPL